MNLTFALAVSALSINVFAKNVSERSHSWAGTNLYFLHALPVEAQVDYVATLSSWGVEVVRLWVKDTDAGCEKGSTTFAIPDLEPNTIGLYNTTVLTAMDKTLSILHAHGIKAIISPHDAGVINGSNGCDVYCQKYGSQSAFYSSATARSEYQARLSTILSFPSLNFDYKPWSQLSEVILAFDIQNEPMINALDLLDDDDPNDWLCGTAGAMKEATQDFGVKIATGGIGGSQYCCDHEYNLLSKALSCDAIDIMSIHGYMSKAADWAYFITGNKSVLNLVNGTEKRVMIEEWGVSSSSEDNFDTQVKVFNDAGVPWVLTPRRLYWQVIPGLDQTQPGAPTNCSYDGFEIGLNSTKGDVSGAVKGAKAAIIAQGQSCYLG